MSDPIHSVANNPFYSFVDNDPEDFTSNPRKRKAAPSVGGKVADYIQLYLASLSPNPSKPPHGNSMEKKVIKPADPIKPFLRSSAPSANKRPRMTAAEKKADPIIPCLSHWRYAENKPSRTPSTQVPKTKEANKQLHTNVPSKFTGHVSCTYFTGEKYDGAWVNGQKHGHGRYEIPGEAIYTGDFLFSKMEGQAEITYADGRFYRGSVRDGKREGFGTLTCAAGEYTGEFKEGWADGKGKFTCPNGTWYEGDFKQGKPHGHGIIVYATSAVYDGEWVNGEMHGFGRYLSPDAILFEGQFEKNQFLG